MGAILSREKSDSKDFEKILSELDLNIRKAEGRLSEIKIRQRRTSFMWIIYSLVIWIGCVVYLFYQLNQIEVQTEKVIYAGVPVLLLPAAIYYIRRGLVLFYDQKQKKEETNLAKLRQEQKGKLEELKKKTSYYTTQSLLEKYDEVLAKKKKEEAAAAAKQQQQQQRKPVTMPTRPMSAGPLSPNQRPFPPQPNGQYPQQQGQMQHQGPILPPPQPRSEPQWYDKIVDALVGDAGPETKYALICTHCFHHNGLVLKEEFDTIQYICPNCKQFNPSRKSKQIIMSQQQEQKSGGHSRSHSEEVKVKELLAVPEEESEEQEALEEEEAEKVIEKLKAEINQDKDTSIGARVRQRHVKSGGEEQEEL